MEALRESNWKLPQDLLASRGALMQAKSRIAQLKGQIANERESKGKRQAQLKGLQQAISVMPTPPAPAAAAADPPAFVKANVPEKPRKKPGRKAGHLAAHRPLPASIDEHIEVPLPYDGQGKASCPECHAELSGVKKHQRVVEDLVLPKLWVKCYHTVSGYCPGCRRVIESRAPEQPPVPPVIDLPQGQLCDACGW